MSDTNGDSLFSLSGQTAVVIGGGGVLAGEMAMGLATAGAVLRFSMPTWRMRRLGQQRSRGMVVGILFRLIGILDRPAVRFRI